MEKKNQKEKNIKKTHHVAMVGGLFIVILALFINGALAHKQTGLDSKDVDVF